jgi:hypothetical protein
MEFREFRLCGAPCLALDLGRSDVMILPVLLLRRRRLEINGAGSKIVPPPLPPSYPVAPYSESWHTEPPCVRPHAPFLLL